MRNLFLILYNFLEDNYHLKKIKFFLKKKIFFKKAIIFDIGSHKGKFSKIFLELYNNIELHCFEANIILVNFLKKKFRNKLFAYNNAVSDSNKFINVRINELNLTSTLSAYNNSSFYIKFKKIILKKQKFFFKKVKSIKLDTFCKKKKINYIDILKIDVEGHEYNVLNGAKKILPKVKYVIIEIQKNDMFKNYSKSKIENFLKKNNFILIKKFRFPFMFFSDDLYKNKNFS